MTSSDPTRPDLRGVEGAHPRGYEGFEGVVAPTASASSPAWPRRVRPRPDAPNVIVVLVDDLGFSDTGPFGSEIPTPALDAVAEEGYVFTDFHVTPLCAPSRAALLTGANPHRAGFGFVPHMDPGYPGYSMVIPDDLPTFAETFRSAGYATFMVGKWHLTPEASLHDGADRSTWPLQRGFDRYFGGMEGFTTLFHPHRIIRDNSPVIEPLGDDEYLTDRLTDEAIGMIDTLRANDPSRPFLLYFAHHAVHGPVQAKSGDIERFRGAYDRGWDDVRRERLRRQQKRGIVSPHVTVEDLDESPDAVPRWDDLEPEQRELFARHMEVYAAAVASVDESLGRLRDHLRDRGELDNTVVVFASDNGATAEGGEGGTRSYFSQFVHAAGLPDDWVRDVPRPLDELGGPRVHGHYPKGWARVSNTPFRQFKGSVYEGGVHSPLVVSWPAGLRRAANDDGLRSGFSFITDIAPTLFELAGVQRPSVARGVATAPADGESLVPVLRGDGPPRRPSQHIALMGQRAFYRDDHKLVGAPGLKQPWRLFDLSHDPTELRDVAPGHPDLVAELAEQFRLAAWHNTVFPLVDDPAAMAARPSTIRELAQPVSIPPGIPTLERYRSSRLIAMRSFRVVVRLEGELAEGVLFSHGDQGGGYAVWIEGGELVLAYNAYGVMSRATTRLPARTVEVVVDFEAVPGFAWSVVAGVPGEEPVRLERVPMLMGMAPFTGISVGADHGGPVDWDLRQRRGVFPYAGTIRHVRYEPGPKAPYSREVVVAVDEITARLKD